MDSLPISRVVPKCATLYAIIILIFSGCTPAPIKSTPVQCRDALGCVVVEPGQSIKIGGLQTLSGGSAPGGMEQQHAIILAVEKRGGQLLGHPIELRFEDDRCSAEGGANAALRIVADPQVVAILGTNCSSAAVTAGKIMSEKGLVMISSANTSPSLTSIDGVRAENWVAGYFRTTWNDELMGRTAASFAFQKLNRTRAAVINAGDAYSKGLTDVFTRVFTGFGGQVVLSSTIDEEDVDLRPVLDAIVLSKAEMIFFPLSHLQSGVRMIQQAKEIPALQNLVFLAGDSMLSELFIHDVGPAGIGVYILGPGVPATSENDQAREAYQVRFGEAPQSYYYSFAIDAANLLLDKLQSVAVQSPDGTLTIGRQALREALYATQDYSGLTGSLSCTPYGDCGVVNLNVLRLESTTRSIKDLRMNIVYILNQAR